MASFDFNEMFQIFLLLCKYKHLTTGSQTPQLCCHLYAFEEDNLYRSAEDVSKDFFPFQFHLFHQLLRSKIQLLLRRRIKLWQSSTTGASKHREKNAKSSFCIAGKIDILEKGNALLLPFSNNHCMQLSYQLSFSIDH